jgi:hypothetical protein
MTQVVELPHLACVKIWVHSPVLPKKKKKSNSVKLRLLGHALIHDWCHYKRRLGHRDSKGASALKEGDVKREEYGTQL